MGALRSHEGRATHPEFFLNGPIRSNMCATTTPYNAGVGGSNPSPPTRFRWSAAVSLPVTMHSDPCTSRVQIKEPLTCTVARNPTEIQQTNAFPISWEHARGVKSNKSNIETSDLRPEQVSRLGSSRQRWKSTPSSLAQAAIAQAVESHWVIGFRETVIIRVL
jgi:hypothetical protein